MSHRPAAAAVPNRPLWPCLLLMAGSGCAALIYEVVWFQLLELVIGSTGVSLGLLLAAYMGGLGLGSAFLARLAPPSMPPLRLYAYLELGIGALGLLALFLVNAAGSAYAALPVSGSLGVILRGLLAAICLLPATFLMGASFPAMSRWAAASNGVQRLGFLYSANIAGAIVGCLGAGFYLLRVHGLTTATYAAVAINVFVAGAAWMLAGNAPVTAAPSASFSGSKAIYAAIALSGLTALGAEVVWTRLLSLLLGGTVYTFSIILAVFLLGLWLGSWGGSYLARRATDPRWALALCQALLAVAIAWTAFTITSVLPYWPVDPLLATSPWAIFDLDLMRCLRTMLPPTLLWGASFPLALASVAKPGDDPARLSGSVYAINTIGSIVGALAFSLVLISSIGTRGSDQLLIWISAAAAICALAAVPRTTNAILTAVATLAVALGLSFALEDMPWQAIAYGRRIAPILRGLDRATDEQAQPVFIGEGRNASVVITRRGDQRFFYVSGKSEASSAVLDMRLQRMMGHLPALFHPKPRSVLIVGFGAGVTAGSFVPYPEVERIEVCELEPMIPPASDEHFGTENAHVLRDRRMHLVIDDARHHILTTREKFDVITTDPIHPWVKGTSTLYSEQYYQLVREHLTPGGIVAQWLPIYESDEQTVKTELATFFRVFPNATVWSSNLGEQGYDLVLVGRTEDTPINVDQLEQRLAEPSHKDVAGQLAAAEFPSLKDLLSTYAGRASDLAPWLTGVEVNNDDNLRLQYLAGMGLNSTNSRQIYATLLSYRKFPEGFLTGSAERLNPLRDSFGRPHREF